MRSPDFVLSAAFNACSRCMRTCTVARSGNGMARPVFWPERAQALESSRRPRAIGWRRPHPDRSARRRPASRRTRFQLRFTLGGDVELAAERPSSPPGQNPCLVCIRCFRLGCRQPCDDARHGSPAARFRSPQEREGGAALPAELRVGSVIVLALRALHAVPLARPPGAGPPLLYGALRDKSMRRALRCRAQCLNATSPMAEDPIDRSTKPSPFRPLTLA